VNEGLAQLSNQFVYAAMGVYTLAFISFAGSLAATRGRTATPVAATAKQPVAVGAGGAADAVGAAAAAAGAGTAAAPAAGKRGKGQEALPPGRRAGNIAMALMWLSTALLLGGVVLRGMSAGRVPWGNMYEFTLTGTFVVAFLYVLLYHRLHLAWMAPVVLVFVLAVLMIAVPC